VRGRFGAIRLGAERAEARSWAARVELRPAEPERPLTEFSGGNQQKVVLAKWLRTKPRLLLLDEPTQGVDIGAKAAIYQLVRRAAADGSAVLVASSDAKELAALCDRVLLIDQGRVTGELAGAALTETALVHAALAAVSPATAASRPGPREVQP
jgi:ABC-type sugar transport system ATPase subunit